MDVLTAKDKKTRCECETTKHHWWQSCFGHGAVVIGLESLKIVSIVVNVHGRCKEYADQKRDKRKTADNWSPASDLLVLDRETFEVGVQNAYRGKLLLEINQQTLRGEDLPYTKDAYMLISRQTGVPSIWRGRTRYFWDNSDSDTSHSSC